ncbi:MAG: S-formylglutathione hydrolase [Roseovarius sp.]|nr:S-formylglutathione hydrolase [Roseovarius sp.]
METLSENRCFGGVQGVHRHRSEVCACDMTFGLYLPPQAAAGPVPLLWYLSGLTCTHENAMTKGGFQEHAARHGLAVIFPDTSPRGESVADDPAYDLGQGAGFYVNATRAPWDAHFRMYDYVLTELRGLVMAAFPLADRHGITGHSMGGHGALTLALRNPEMFASLSAFAPIAHPVRSDWGRKQLGAYLGEDESAWAGHDSVLLLEERGWHGDILVDQGTADDFLDLLMPEALAGAMARRRQPGQFRLQPGYDHSYFFVSSFAADHVAWHAERLGPGRAPMRA